MNPQASDLLPSGMRFWPFVALLGALMAVNALGIDTMLPALPAMGGALGVASDNDRQWVVSAYVLGLGLAQLIYGPIADRFGRKPPLVISTLLAGGFAIAGGLSNNFAVLLAFRLLQGAAAAGARVLVVAIVRDCLQGAQMARVMSLALLVLLVVPVFAPGIGQAILLLLGWRAIFFAIGLFAIGTALAAWVWLGETLPQAQRRSVSLASLGEAVRIILHDRASLIYSLGGALIYGALIGYITSVQQIFEGFGATALFPVAFSGMGLFLGAASILNARLVRRRSVRQVAHAALVAFTIVGAVHLAYVASGGASLSIFILLQALTMGCFGLIAPNFGAIAMEGMGAVAGAAASLQGFITTCGGAVVGTLIGQSYAGTSLPLALSTVVIGCVIGCLVLIGRARNPKGVDDSLPPSKIQAGE